MPVPVNDPKLAQQVVVVTYQLGNQTFALPIAPVRQIIEMVTITPVPQVKGELVGLINFHGALVPIVNMRSLLGMEEIPFTLYTPIILVNISERLIGLIVDKVLDVLEIPGIQVIDPSNILLKEMGDSPVLLGLIQAQGESIPLLNTEYLFKPYQTRTLLEAINTQIHSVETIVLSSAESSEVLEQLPNAANVESPTPGESEPQPVKSSTNRRVKKAASTQKTQEVTK